MEATDAICHLSAELVTIKQTLQLDDDDFVKFHAEERAYLESLCHLPIKDQLSIRYAEVLDELEQRKYVPQCDYNSVMIDEG